MQIFTDQAEASPLQEAGYSGLELIRKPERFHAIKHDWNLLWLRCGHCILESFDGCLNVWETNAAPDGHHLYCIAGWCEGSLIAFWPLISFRKVIWRYVRPLDLTSAEHTNILFDETVDQQHWMEQAWQLVIAKTDVVMLPHFRKSAQLERLLFDGLYSATVDAGHATYIDLRSEETWDSYYRSLNASRRKDNTRATRQLSELGSLTWEIIDAGDSRCSDLVRWVIEQKRGWSQRQQKESPWLYSEKYVRFLTRLLTEPHSKSRGMLTCLSLDDIPLAVNIAAVNQDCVEALILGFDVRYKKYSPGVLLNEHFLRWAFEQQLNCDLGTGGDLYKGFWSRKQFSETKSYHIAVSRWGRLAILAQTVLRYYRALTHHARPRLIAHKGQSNPHHCDKLT
jgi:CelD/BcsL family acetyltransferase involved in cellulose biosynthesis